MAKTTARTTIGAGREEFKSAAWEIPNPFPQSEPAQISSINLSCLLSVKLHIVSLCQLILSGRRSVIMLLFQCFNVLCTIHTHMSSSYRSSRLGLSHWDPYAMHRGGCLELYYCNMVEWSWWDSNLIWKTNWFPSVLWHCWFGRMTCKNRPRNDL